MKKRDGGLLKEKKMMNEKKSIILPDPYPNETVEEIIEHCHRVYYEQECDKFKNFKEVKEIEDGES